MSVAPIGAFAPITPPTATAATPTTGGNAFTDGLAQVQGLQTQADTLAQQMATGQLTDLSQYTTAAAKASLAIQLTSALRDKAVEAYQSIMGMQV